MAVKRTRELSYRVELKTESGTGELTISVPVPSPTLAPATAVAPTVTSPMATMVTTTTTPAAHTTATIAGIRGMLLQVRSQPDEEVTGHLVEGTQVFVLEGPVLQGSTGWYLVQMPDDTTGWVVGDYVIFRDE